MAQSQETEIAVLKNELGYVDKKVDKLDDKVTSHYVSTETFEPVKKIVYGLVSLILIAVVGALVSLVINK